ncbi:hypothetical protein EV193_103513 [Herbihabitans rhizosphaerae]|uniref:Uncharacterized protein n=1 Tax=Herbihabitans rhizosphaerae TaxID=1872711 RepID=A0A4V2ETI5_9PSEU|nr:hypothetical protein [Herbihabitans rhizosphaerae]RZS41193.1 hypothetical protein EV193_103513 [Herbihabitans rhizosphaerae]
MRHALATCLAAVVAVLLLAPATATAQDTPPTPEKCAATLACGLDDIDKMTMSDRLDMVRLIESGPTAEYLGADIDPGRWRNIEGIVTLFRNHGLGARGSWVSYVDAGIIEGLERGLAIASGRGTDTGGNPGSQLWAEYLVKLKAGELTTRSVHDRVWSIAEQASTEHGVRVAEQVHGERPSAREDRFFQLSEIYRFMLRNRPPLLDLVTAVGGLTGPERQNFYDWATDVTNAEAGVTGAEVLWGLARADVPDTLFATIRTFQAYFESLLPLYENRTR